MIQRLGKVIGSALISFLPFFVVGCGTQEQNVVTNFHYKVQEGETLAFDLEFTKDIELGTELRIPVLQYGAVTLLPGDQNLGFRLGAELNLKAIPTDGRIGSEITQRLPNGAMMPSYVKTPLNRLRVMASPDVAASLYVGPDLPNFYVGISLELGFLGEKFPAGLTISQLLRDAQKRPLGVVTFYGPMMNGDQVVVPGGFFFVTHAGDLISYAKGMKAMALGETRAFQLKLFNDPLTISPEHRKSLDSAKEQKKLLKLFNESAQENGF